MPPGNYHQTKRKEVLFYLYQAGGDCAAAKDIHPEHSLKKNKNRKRIIPYAPLFSSNDYTKAYLELQYIDLSDVVREA